MAGCFARLAEVLRRFPKGMSKEERQLVRKLDLLVLPYACLSFFVRYLDVSALTNAYVSGMKEDLNLAGDRLNYINAAYEVGYVVFQIPSNLVLLKYPAQYYLPFAEMFWGFFTLGTAFVITYEQLVVMRFVGLSAASCYVGLVHVVNSWYRKQELGRRNALFWIANPLSQMIFVGRMMLWGLVMRSAGIRSLWLFDDEKSDAEDNTTIEPSNPDTKTPSKADRDNTNKRPASDDSSSEAKNNLVSESPEKRRKGLSQEARKNADSLQKSDDKPKEQKTHATLRSGT
ncbi:major facilitator superfamily domain-containing protein [Aspergillus filifer]